ncbi:MAG: Zn-ribbon domain-containing OB-fold protein [Calditrichaceae bacterium]|nr:Zn-ribbon domain-containing OB-fold protein [Calditrichaceae bacterium]MBN2707648.1 Zn-ribbon domain-containing OB-fold protein [Calditrichaceae bacterium]RQV93182.1 MAG: Zn-ribbon domain-containing OB-fold protein [Calditrichota bacterium]
MDIPRYWRLKSQRYRLQGRRCTDCGSLSFPPRQVCMKCKSRNSEPYEFKGKGKLYSYTTIYQSPDRFEQIIPYVVALVDLEEGVRITAQLTDYFPEQLEIGMDLEMVIRQIYEDGPRGPILYGYKFRPILCPGIES